MRTSLKQTTILLTALLLMLWACKKDEATPTYTVTFEVDGGSAVDAQTIEAGSRATAPAAPTLEGHTFEGWYTDNTTFENEFNFTTAITQDITLYAKWEPITYTVTFNSNEGSAVSAQTIDHGSTASQPDDPTRQGHTFGGWYTDNTTFQNTFDFDTPITSDTTLYAGWDINTYTVTFDSNEGSALDPQTVNENGTTTEPAPTREGYTLTGWFTDSGLNNAFDFSTPITGNITLYAQWTINTYTVSFEVNGGSAVTQQMIEHGNLTAEPTAPTREGHTFADWFTDDGTFQNRFDFDAEITGDVTLYARWEPITYTVTFEVNGGSAIDPQPIGYGGMATEPAPTRTNHTLTGWYLDAAFGGNAFDFANTAITGNITLHAKWAFDSNCENGFLLTRGANATFALPESECGLRLPPEAPRLNAEGTQALIDRFPSDGNTRGRSVSITRWPDISCNNDGSAVPGGARKAYSPEILTSEIRKISGFDSFTWPPGTLLSLIQGFGRTSYRVNKGVFIEVPETTTSLPFIRYPDNNRFSAIISIFDERNGGAVHVRAATFRLDGTSGGDQCPLPEHFAFNSVESFGEVITEGSILPRSSGSKRNLSPI